MFVGEAPGEREDQIHKPFQGRAGQMLDSFFKTFGINRTEVFISNAVHCRPPDNDTPDWKHIAACRKYLEAEVRRVRPKLIVALGAVAAKSLLNRRSVSIADLRGKLHTMEGTKIPVVVTYHPAGILRNNYFMEPAVEDFEWVMRILSGDEKPKESEIKYRMINEPWNNIRLKDSPIAVDFETTSLDTFTDDFQIRFVQICQEEGIAYICPWTPKVQAWFRDEIARNDKLTKIGHNIRYEFKCAGRYGIRFKGEIFDTLIAGHLIDENMPDKSLDYMATRFTPVKHHKDAMHKWQAEDKTRMLVDAPNEILIPYACGDVDATYRLFKIFRAKLKANDNYGTLSGNLWELFKFQMEVLKGPLFEMEYRGIKVDMQLLPQLRKYYKRRIRKYQEILHERVARAHGEFGTTLNVNSHVQLKAVWYKQWHFPALGKSKKWNAPPLKNTAEDTVLKLIHWLKVNRPVFWKSKIISLETVLEIRANRKLLSTYIDGMSDYIREGDLIHANFKMHGTVTGRWSCGDPGLQTIPRKGEIKKLFISRYGEDGCIFKCDLSQAELRWAAWIADERNMIRDLSSGKDIHKIVASKAFKIPFDKVTDDQRKRAKTVNFGILYQAGKYKMAESMGCSVDEAEEFINGWFELYPGFRRDVLAVKNEIRDRGFVRAWSGRVRRVPVLQPEGKEFQRALREGFNSRIQGGVSDFLVLGMLELYKEIKKRKIEAVFIANVHDEIVLDTLKIHTQELSDLCVDIFTKRNIIRRLINRNLTVPIEVETAAGPNWLEVTPIHGAKDVKKA